MKSKLNISELTGDQLKRIPCPICKGNGKIFRPKRLDDYRLVVAAAKILRKNGYSIREIMVLLGYKSPNTIQVILKKGDGNE